MVTSRDVKPGKRAAKRPLKDVPSKPLGVDKARNVRGGQGNPKKGGLGGGGGKGL